MPEVGSASLAIIPSFNGFQSKLEGGTGKALTAAGVSGGSQFGDSAGRSASGKFAAHIKRAGKIAAVGLAGAAAVAFKIGADSVQAASDLAESTNKVQQVFGKGADSVFKFAEKAADKFGQTNQQARDAAATFGIFGKVAELSGRKNAKFAIQMDKLASDLASFHNTSPEEAIEAIGAAMRGEAEPIRKYGVLLDEATLKAEALSMGLLKPVKDQSKIKSYQVSIIEGQQKYNEAVAKYGKDSIEALKAEASLGTYRERLRKATEGTIPPLTQQEKVLAAQSVIMKQTKVAQGDFARTSDGLANAQRRLTARWEDAKAKLGTALLPTVNRFVKFLLDRGIPAVEKFADWFNRDGIKRMGDFGDKVKTVASHAKDLVGWLNDLPKPAKIAGLAAILGGAGYMKLRGGSGGGALGTIGKAVGLVKPIKTFETNPAALGGGVGGAAGNATGKVAAILNKGVLPVAIVAASFKGLKEFFDWNHRDDKSAVEHAITGGNMGDKSREFWGWVTGSTKADKASDAKAQLDNVANAADKVERQLGDTKNAGEKLRDVLFEIDRTDPKVEYRAPGFDVLLAHTREYKSLLDGLPRRVVTEFVQNVTRNNDTGEGGGGIVPGRSPREGVTINVDKVEAHNYRDFMNQMQQRTRGAALDGVR